LVTDFSRHILLSNADGDPLDQDTKPFTDQRFDDYVARMLENVQNTAPTVDGKKQVLIHIHGGLNTLETSRKRVVKLAPEIMEKGGYYPILFGWRSGPIISYFEHLFVIRQGRKRKKRAFFSFPFVFGADLGRGLVRANIVLFRQLAIAVKATPFNWSRDTKNAKTLYRELRKKFLDAHESTNSDATSTIQVSRGGDSRKLSAKLTRFFSYVLLGWAKMISGILIDGFGTAAWDNMVRRTRVVFRTPSEFDLGKRRDNPAAVEQTLSSPATGAISRLFKALTDFMKPADNQDVFESDYEITLVGHSMGAIIMNHIVSTFPDLPYKKIVYMGAACTVREFKENVIPYLIEHPETQFHNLCLHPVAEAREIPLQVADILPRGSLLEWIDAMFSTPQTLMDRTLGKWENIMQATHVIPENILDQVTIKSFGVGGDQGKPQRHGDFNDIDFWSDEVLNAERPPVEIAPEDPDGTAL
jgi:pimeloyl-ACP methyl ester carboxylesterase